jgi:hypothetical protein
MTTMPKYRGTKTQAQVYAEVLSRLGTNGPTVENITRILCQVIIDWTIACWKIEPIGDGLIGFQCGCGGSAPVGSEPPNDFVGIGVNLNGHWGPAGSDRAEAAFSAQKVGEQSRVTPVFAEVYDSASRTPNHYVAGMAITIITANRNGKFDPTKTGNVVRVRKADGTYAVCTVYPYYKGNTIVAVIPAGVTGAVELHLSMEINGSIREGIYPFPLT